MAAMGLEEALTNISTPSFATWPCARLLRKNSPQCLAYGETGKGMSKLKGMKVAIMGKDSCSNGSSLPWENRILEP